MADIWPGFSVSRFKGESESSYIQRASRIREIIQTFRHRYYTKSEAIALERELERLESAPLN
jgi:hypothetical protein